MGKQDTTRKRNHMVRLRVERKLPRPAPGSLEQSLVAWLSPVHGRQGSTPPTHTRAGEQVQGLAWTHVDMAWDPGSASKQLHKLSPII